MFDKIRSALQGVAGGAEKLRNVLSLPDASIKLLRFVSDDIWGSRGRCRVISRSIAEYLVQAWDVQCSLFLPLQRGAGPMALMLWLDWVT
jgi:hypothetical protein